MMLLDSNIVIYSIRPEYPKLREFIEQNRVSVSGISYVEVLGFHRLAAQDRQRLELLIEELGLLEITRPILDRAVQLRQQRKLSLGDSIIAATALIHGLTLITRNTADFAWISGLKLLDPLAQP